MVRKNIGPYNSISRSTLAREYGDGVISLGESELPKTLGDCPKGRPCPYVSCRYNLTLDVTPRGGLEFITARRIVGDEEDIMKIFGDLTDNCVFDYEKYDGMPLDEIGMILGVTRERVRQIEQAAFFKIKRYLKYDREDIEFKEALDYVLDVREDGRDIL